MNANRVRHRRMRRLLPLSITCCLVAFCPQLVSEVRFKPALQVRQADAVWSRAAAADRSLLVVR